LERGEDSMELLAPFQHHAVLADQRIGALALTQGRALLNPDFRLLGGSTEGGEHGDFAVHPKRIVAPVAGRDHPPVEIEDAVELGPVERRERLPLPGTRERRDHAQALFLLAVAVSRSIASSSRSSRIWRSS